MSHAAETLTHRRVIDPSASPRIAERLKGDVGAEAVIVYGSVARGDATVNSDIDLLVIAPPDGDHERWLERVRRAIDDSGYRLPISPLVLTPDQVRRRLEADDRFIRQIIESGVELGPGSLDVHSRWGDQADARIDGVG